MLKEIEARKAWNACMIKSARYCSHAARRQIEAQIKLNLEFIKLND